MKYKTMISISTAFALSIITLVLMTYGWTTSAAPPARFMTDTGMITLGPNQSLRLTVAPSPAVAIEESVTFVYGRIRHSPGACIGGVCTYAIASRTMTDPITLRGGEASSTDMARTAAAPGVRVMLFSNSDDIQVNALIINSTTAESLYFYPLPRPIRLIDDSAQGSLPTDPGFEFEQGDK